MCGDVSVTLLITVVLAHVVQEITTYDDGALHLVGLDHTLEDTATNADIASEGALLVDVLALDGLLGGLEAETNVLPVPQAAVGSLLAKNTLLAQEDGGLLLERTLSLQTTRKCMQTLMRGSIESLPAINPNHAEIAQHV